MKSPFITIAVPIYNNEKSIQEAIDSCLDQNTNIFYEILILDDASDDSTPQILKKYTDKKIRIVTLENRVPLIENHNKCLEYALGEYILFCHADDTLEKHAISTITAKLEERNYPEKYVLWGHSMFRDYGTQMQKAGFKTDTIIEGINAALLPMNGGLTPSGTCYSRSALLALGGFMHVDIMTAPSDITTMIYMALNDFSFEMMDEMIFIRKDASTFTSDTTVNDFLLAYDNAYKYLLQNISDDKINNLLDLSKKLKQAPYYFYYSIAQEARFKEKIRKIIFTNLLSSPWALKRNIVRKTLLRIV